MRDHTKLRASELADEVVLLIYRATREFPKEEMYGLAPNEKGTHVRVRTRRFWAPCFDQCADREQAS